MKMPNTSETKAFRPNRLLCFELVEFSTAISSAENSKSKNSHIKSTFVDKNAWKNA